MPPCYGALAITAENSFYTNRAIDLPAVQNEHTKGAVRTRKSKKGQDKELSTIKA
jgi:hypothetical protein